jgi:hypothetical protein
MESNKFTMLVRKIYESQRKTRPQTAQTRPEIQEVHVIF